MFTWRTPVPLNFLNEVKDLSVVMQIDDAPEPTGDFVSGRCNSRGRPTTAGLSGSV
jgi:hypothetical protein